MDRRKRFFRAGLLIFLFAVFCGPFGFSQSEDGAPPDGPAQGEEAPPSLEVRTEISAASPYVNRPWSIFVMVNHPVPSEVNVKPPRFSPSLVLERVRTETRFIRRDSDPASSGAASGGESTGDRWTRVEFLFTPQKAGAVTIDPFGVSVKTRQALTQAINIRFREEPQTVKRYDPRFRWIGPAPSVRCGEKGQLTVELGNWDPLKKPPQGLFQGRTPSNAILEEGLPEAAGEGIFRYTISITPLEESSVTLEAFSFSSDIYKLSIPALTVAVLPAQNETPVQPEPLTVSEVSDSPPAGVPADLFSGNVEKVFPLFRSEYRQIVTKVRLLWEQNSRANALAEIRRNERDSLCGPFLAPLRREMELALGLSYTENERWRPLTISLLTWAIAGLLVIFALSAVLVFRPGRKIKKKNVTSRSGRGFKVVIIYVLLAGLALIFLEEGFGNFLLGRLSPPLNTAVLEKTEAYRIPDGIGAVNALFPEGQPVSISDSQSDWCYAESADGKSGWVRREAVIMY